MKSSEGEENTAAADDAAAETAATEVAKSDTRKMQQIHKQLIRRRSSLLMISKTLRPRRQSNQLRPLSRIRLKARHQKLQLPHPQLIKKITRRMLPNRLWSRHKLML
jgi:hypothetical protein